VREDHPSDRRVTLIRLTESARDLNDKYNQVSDDMTHLFYQGFTPEDIEILETYLGRLLTNLEDADS
jgi:DNA-binding MarR family transcriptional regulator